MAKVTFVFTDDGNDVDIVADFDPHVSTLVSERTNAQNFALRVSQFITEYGNKHSEGVTVELEDDKGNVNLKTYVKGIEVKPDDKTN